MRSVFHKYQQRIRLHHSVCHRSVAVLIRKSKFYDFYNHKTSFVAQLREQIEYPCWSSSKVLLKDQACQYTLFVLQLTRK